MPVSPRQMPFFEHFHEIKKRLTICLVVVLVLSFVFYSEKFFGFFMDIFLAPVREFLPDGKLTTMGPFEMLTFRFKISLFASLIASSPVLLYQFFAFITPALKPRERKWVFPTVAAAIVLFIGGASFAYFVIMGPAFEWLTSQGGGQLNSIAAANPYLSGIGMMLIGFGVGFELPLVVFYLIGLNIVSYDKIRGGWRYAYVVIIIVASVATPDWSPWTMGGLAGALILLYEGSLGLSRVVFSKRIKEQRKAEKEYEEYYADGEDASSEKTEEAETITKKRLTKKQQMIAEAAQKRRDAAKAEAAAEAGENSARSGAGE